MTGLTSEAPRARLRPRPDRVGRPRCLCALADQPSAVAAPDSSGDWLAGHDGGVVAFGGAPFEGSLPGDHVVVGDVFGGAGT